MENHCPVLAYRHDVMGNHAALDFIEHGKPPLLSHSVQGRVGSTNAAFALRRFGQYTAMSGDCSASSGAPFVSIVLGRAEHPRQQRLETLLLGWSYRSR